ncbi:MAG: tetratricopeptide repeat protein [Candidatus Omnitrophica bacterium]|nr:tetratricopeptide repeat protein [Candidatus Omnitrophota bacterium]
MLKKKIILYLLLTLWAIGETDKDYLKLAITSSEKGFYELSNKYLEEYIAKKEENFLDLVYLIYGYNLFNLEKYPSAIEKLEIVIKRFPLSPYLKNAYLYLIPSYLKINNLENSLTYYREYKNKFGKEANLEKQIGKTILERGIYFFKNKNFIDAKNNFNIIIREFEDVDLLVWSNYYLGLIEFEISDFKKAIEYFQKVIESGKGDMVSDGKLKIGDCYFNLGDYEKAEIYYQELLKEDNIFSEWAKFQISIIEKRKGNLEKAKGILKNVKYFGDDELKFNVLNELSGIYILLEDWKEAENILNEILNTFPQRKEIPEIYFKLGVVNFNKKNFDNAIKFFKASISLSKGNTTIEKSLFFLGYLYYIKNDFNKSFESWENLKTSYPESSFIPMTLFLKGKKFYEDKKFEQAENLFKEVIEKETVYYEDACFYLIDILIKRKKLEEGEFYAMKLVEKKKDSKNEFLLGKIFYLKGEYEKAEQIFNNLKTENPSIKAEMSFYLGDIYKKKGNIEKAKEKFIEVISLYPQFKEWKELSEKSLKQLGK